jgi:A/G-specific adenine glycosylase
MLGRIEHVFSHLIWNLHVFTGTIQGQIKEASDLRLVSLDEIVEFAFPVSHQRILRLYRETGEIK